MKVTKVVPRVIRRPMGGRLWNPRTRWHEKVIVLVFLETDGGHVGVGEAWSTAASPRALVATIEDDLAPLVVGEDHQWLWDRLPEGTFAPRQGYVRPPAGPGLGIALTPDDV